MSAVVENVVVEAAIERATWVRICKLDDIPALGARVLERVDADNIALFRTATDQVYAVLDRCPHKGGPLSQGIVAGETVTCPLHNWNIALATGEACTPDVGCVRKFAARVEAGEVWLSLDDLPAYAERAG
jgi:nitrite reductase (NADH) small subunit